MKLHARHVVHKDGAWRIEVAGAEEIESSHRTQKEAIDIARARLRADGGGELIIHKKTGQIRARDSVGDQNDPRGSRG